MLCIAKNKDARVEMESGRRLFSLLIAVAFPLLQIPAHAQTAEAAPVANTPIPATQLASAQTDPYALLSATLEQCKLLPTPLACYAYTQDVLAASKDGQGRLLPQILAPAASFLGRYADAARWDPFNGGGRSKPADASLPSGCHAVNAVDGVAALAKDRRLVLLNEWHLDASTRYLTLALLPKLYQQGFRYLAVEGLDEESAPFSKRRYAIAETGYYTQEPVYAWMLSQAVRSGYTLVKYDSSASPQQTREDAQAQNIYAATFAKDPKARVLVHAGVEHIGENSGGFGPKVQPMAMKLKALSGFDPLTVDQTTMRSQMPGKGTPLYQQLLQTYSPQTPSILLSAQGTPWSARAGVTDVTVLAPALHPTEQRPSWLSLGGMRRPSTIYTQDCRDTLPCTVSARPVNTPDTAIPDDLFAFFPNEPQQTKLYLAPGRSYQIEARDSEGRVLSKRMVKLPK